MKNIKTKVATGITVVFLGGLTGLALSQGGKAPSKTVADKPVVHTKVIRRTIHVTKHAKPKHPPAAAPVEPGSTAGAPVVTGSSGSGSSEAAPVTTGSSGAGVESAPVTTGSSGAGSEPAAPVTTGSSGTGGEAAPVTTGSSGGAGGGEVESGDSHGGGGGGDD